MIVDTNVEDESWLNEDVLIKDKIKTTFTKIIPKTYLNKYIQNGVDIELSLLLTNDNKIQKLNYQYRGKNKPTNVLSFPLNDKNFKPQIFDNLLPIGDIILSYETLKKESITQNKCFTDHLNHLIIHGFLHLIGYDHIKQNEFEIMKELEIKLLKILDIGNPYNYIDLGNI